MPKQKKMHFKAKSDTFTLTKFRKNLLSMLQRRELNKIVISCFLHKTIFLKFVT